MKTKDNAAQFVPRERKLAVLAEAVQKCKACDLYRNSTQAVFGEIEARDGTAPSKIAIMMVGEQPGDQEDKLGRPFVGPAGKLLDKALDEAEIDRSKVYVTNVVKHFKWEPRGKLRIHKKPTMREIHACRPWLDAELETLRPTLVVALGATAAQALLGSSFKLTEAHGKVQEVRGMPPIIATLHPSAVLRALTDEDRHSQMELLVADLREAARIAENPIKAAASNLIFRADQPAP
ncbi:MAG: UdgX family uracil-DNA binding protein [Terracidiphilus sp.]